MQLSLNLTGTITVVHRIETDQGTSPAATQADLEAFGAKLMSVLSDKIAAVTASFEAAATRVQDEVAGLKTQIAALQQQVDSGGASQADVDALDALKVKLDQLEEVMDAMTPPDGGTTPPPPGP